MSVETKVAGVSLFRFEGDKIAEVAKHPGKVQAGEKKTALKKPRHFYPGRISVKGAALSWRGLADEADLVVEGTRRQRWTRFRAKPDRRELLVWLERRLSRQLARLSGDSAISSLGSIEPG